VTGSVDGLLRDKTRLPGKPPVTPDRTQALIRLTLVPLPH
jgi:hypothetical protein